MKKKLLLVLMFFIVSLVCASVAPACDSSGLQVTLLDAVFTKSAGAPVTLSKTFPALKGQAVLTAEGDWLDHSTIMVNGNEVFSQSDQHNNYGQDNNSVQYNSSSQYNNSVQYNSSSQYNISVQYNNYNSTQNQDTVSLQNGLNKLTVTFKGKPASKIHVKIMQNIDADAAAVIGPSGGTATTGSRPGAEVVIPPGALSDSAVVTIKATGLEGVTGGEYTFYSTIQPFLKPVTVALIYVPSTLPKSIREQDLTLSTTTTYGTFPVVLRPVTVDLTNHKVKVATKQFTTCAIGAYQPTGVTINQLSSAAGFRMPIGDSRLMNTVASCGQSPSTQDLGANLSLLKIGTSGSPKITFNFNSATGDNQWYVGTGFNQLASSGGYYSGEDWYMQGKNAAGRVVNAADRPVHAVADGIVVFNQKQWAYSSSYPDKSVGLGNMIIIAHKLANGDMAASVYGHLEAISPCAPGSSVKEGDVIGLIDDGQDWYDHLHFELAKGYKPTTDGQAAVEYLFRVDPATGEIKVPVRVLKRYGTVVSQEGWYAPQDDSDFVQKNYYNPSPFIQSYSPIDPINPHPIVTPPVVAMSPTSGPVGTVITESGTGFTPSGFVVLHYKKPDGMELPTLSITADANGHFGTTYTFPADQPAGVYTWWAIDSTTALKSNEVSFEIKNPVPPPPVPQALVAMNPTSGPPGTIVAESGSGFTPNGIAILHYKKPDGTELPTGSITAGVNGQFGTTYTFPADQPAGIYTFWAVDGTRALKSNEVSFEIKNPVPPPPVPQAVVAMSPTSGPPGTIVAESGSGFTPNGIAILHYKKPDGTELPTVSVTAEANGHLGTTYTLPADQPAGIYTWWAIDSTTALKSNEVNFEIQAAIVVPDAEIYYDLVNLGGNTWQYTYTIQNNKLVDSLGGLSWFATFFPTDTDASGNFMYSGLADAGSLPYNWRSQILQPSTEQWRSYEPRGVYGCTSDATVTYDSSGIPHRLVTPLLPGNTLTGFAMTFTYTGNGTPGPQEFSVDDLNGSQNLLKGVTKPRTP